MPLEETRTVVERYVEEDDIGVLHESAIFVDVMGGVRHEGRDAIVAMFHHWYTDPFDADAQVVNVLCGDDGFVAEYIWEGRHVGEWDGIAPTGKTVQTRFAAVYTVDAGKIVNAHIYMPHGSIRDQLT